MSFRFVRDRGLVGELERDSRFRAALKVHANRVKDAAKKAAPRRPGRGRHYRDTLSVTESADGPSVESDDIAAHLIEFGSINNPPYAPLRRGVRAAGLDMKESNK